MDSVATNHLNDPHRLEFEEYIYDTHRTADDLRHLLMKQYDEIQELRRGATRLQPTAAPTA